MLRKQIRLAMVRGILRMRGFSDDQIDSAFKAIEKDTGKPIIDWLINGGLEDIIALIVMIIGLIGGGMSEGAVGEAVTAGIGNFAQVENLAAARPVLTGLPMPPEESVGTVLITLQLKRSDLAKFVAGLPQ